ncbi:putative ABC metal ion transporter [Pleurostoma richardsiae]|uniref:ABC metal ion transporter n=1 Tax=Pleurostoma richardsiae TaxID=41990 RepID=A0AA38VMQ0_9PEZI|nr:putative ABC metal ion transporter [Pleurostoma richardsiae]
MTIIGVMECEILPQQFMSSTSAWIFAYAGSFAAELSFSLPAEDSEDKSRKVWSFANVFDKCTFSWLELLMQIGTFVPLKVEDLPYMPINLALWVDQNNSNVLVGKGEVLPGLLTILLRHCRREYLLSLFFELLDVACKFSMPWLLQDFLVFLRPSTAATFFVINAVDTVATTQAAFQLKRAGAKVKGLLVSNAYDKLLTLPLDSESGQQPSVINLVEVDTQRIQDYVQYIHAIWSAPLQILVCLIGIGIVLGWASSAGALAAMLLFLPVMHILNLLQHHFQMEYMEKRDKRLSITSEIFRKIKQVKIQGILFAMERRADQARRNELAVGLKMNWVSAGVNVILRTAPTLSSVAAFGVAIAIGTDLRTEVLFSALLLFGLLVYPLSLLPAVVLYWASSKVSYARLKNFFERPGLPSMPRTVHNANSDAGPTRVVLRDVSCRWNREDQEEGGLFDMTFSIERHGLVTIDGKLGSGKSTFLNLCLGALSRYTGDITVKGTVAFMPQVPWLKAGSVRDNILFGRQYDVEFYRQVVQACALEQDFIDLPRSDETEIDTIGAGLSGGQKTRIMLARAVYTQADIYLLDDPLSALDSKTKAWVVKRVLGPCGILRNRIRIVTSSAMYLQSLASQVVTISGGHLQQDCDHSLSDEATVLLESDKLQACESESSQKTPASVVIGISELSMDADTDMQLKQDCPSTYGIADLSLNSLHALPSTILYRRFFGYAGYVAWTAVTVAILASYAANMLSTYVLKKMGSGPASDTYSWMVLYALCCVSQSALIFLWLMMAWFLCNFPTSLQIHADLVRAVLVSPMRFFRRVSVGEILNRFTNDLSRLDSPIFGLIYGFLNAATRTLATLLLLTIVSPLSLAFTIPLLTLFLLLQRRYVHIAVQLRKLETASRGPILDGIGEAATGRSIIRTSGQVQNAQEQHRLRVLRYMRVYFSSFSLEQWLVFRAGMLAAIASGVCPAILLYVSADPATIGLVMNFILQLSGSLAITAVVSTQIESEMVSFRRIQELCANEREGAGPKTRIPPPAAWPMKGEIEFDDVTASYDDESGPILRDISLNIQRGQKVGIVGRSGAGKSSFASILLGLLDVDHGCVRIDNIDIATLTLNELRQRVITITQEPIAFSGTVRENLDPNGEFDTMDLLRALEDSHFASSLPDPQGALDFQLVDGGVNVSMGQLQLLAIARCLLHRSNILILDEATASVDVNTETIIIEIIREHFRDRTVITIAHRLRTIVDSDLIIVMEAGQVKETGSPSELYQDGGAFKELVDEEEMSKEFDVIRMG